jgi:hypothetical protein
MPLWQSHPQAVAILSRITPDSLVVRRNCVIVGQDYYVLEGADHDADDLIDELDGVRTGIIDRAFGETFNDANRADRGRAYLAHWQTYPTVEEVLADRFGDPRRFAGLDAYQATLRWRAEAIAALAQGLAA